MTAEELRDSGAGAAVVAGAISAVGRVFGRHGGSGRTHRRVRAAIAARAAADAAARARAAIGRTFRYERAPEAIYQTQPAPVPPPTGVFQISPWINLLLWVADTRRANELARESAQAAVDASAPWYAREDVYGPPGPYESGAFYGLNFPLLAGSRQDPRGISGPAARHFGVRTPFLGGVTL